MMRFLFGMAGFLFCFFTLTGRDLAETGNILWTTQYTIKTLLCSLVLGALLGEAVRRGFRWLIRRGENASEPREDKIMKILAGRKPWQIWLLSGILIVLSWLPCYLAYYPGICAYDTPIQLSQVTTHAYNDHHPLAHTLLLGLGLNLGKSVFGDANTGIALLVLLQMMALAFCMAWGVMLLTRKRIGGRWIALLQLLCMFYPFHKYMSVSVTKDILFSVFFLVQLMALYECIHGQKKGIGTYDVLFFVSSIGMQLFRNNGKYAVLLLQGALLLAFLSDKKERKRWGKLAVNCLTALVGGSLLLWGLSGVTHAVQGDKRELLSVPIQQLARCMVYHGGADVMAEDDNTMEETDKALVREFLLNESYKLYDPGISDPVKRNTNTYVVRYRTGEFLKTYLKLFLKYPGDYVNAVLALDAGYFYLGDRSHAVVNENDALEGLGYVQTRWDEAMEDFGIYKDSRWEGRHGRLEKWANENAHCRLPVLKYLLVPASLFWGYVLLLLYLLMQGSYRNCVPLILVFGYYATLFFGPVVQLRYLYPLMAVFPFVCLTAGKRRG